MYHRQVEQILYQITEANESVAQFQAAPRGTLRVHSRMLVGHHAIVPAIPRFLDAYPDITIDLALSNFAIDLTANNIDVDVRTGKLADSALIARKLTGSERVVCAAPEYLDRHAPVEQPSDLALHNCLAYCLNQGRTVWHFKASDGTQAEVPVTGSLRSDNGQALLVGVHAGLGIALMPDWAVHEDLRTARLRRLFPDHRVSHVEFDDGVYAVYQRSRHMSPKIRVFVDFIGAVFRDREGACKG